MKQLFVSIFILISFAGVQSLFCQTGPINGSGGGIIAFTSNREGTNEIYLMNADGSAQTKVTNYNAFNFGLAWSPDGSRLAFCSSLMGGFEIFIMDVFDITTGAFYDPVRITNNNVMDFSPTWSPDGTKLAFDSEYNSTRGIVILELNSGVMQLLDTSPIPGDQPTWSPDGSQIAFASGQGIHSIKIDATELTQITSGYSIVPTYSPEGSKIAYVTMQAAEDIFIVNSDGTGKYRLTTSVENDFVPSWSPDGNRIVYEGTVNGNDQICVIDTDGTNYKQLTNSGVNTGPAWYPILNPTSVDESESMPTEFALFQNYPNPFNPSTNIRYQIFNLSQVKLLIFDAIGNEIVRLVDAENHPGRYEVEFDGSHFSSGVYYYKLIVNSKVSIKNMLLLK